MWFGLSIVLYFSCNPICCKAPKYTWPYNFTLSNARQFYLSRETIVWVEYYSHNQMFLVINCIVECHISHNSGTDPVWFIYRGGGGFPEGVHYYVGPGVFSPRKYLKCEAWKCHFLHSEHYVYLLNLSSQTQYLYFGKKLRKVLRYMVTHRIAYCLSIGARIFSRIPVFENRNCINESE